MLKKNLAAVILCIAMLLVGMTAAEAEKSEWQNQNYDIKKLKHIRLECSVPEECRASVVNEYIDRIAAQTIVEKSKKYNVNIMTREFAGAQLDLLYDGKYAKLLASDARQAADLANDYIRRNCNAVLNVKIIRCDYDSIYHEGHTYETTEYREVKVKNSDGSWSTVKYPETVTKYVEPYTEKIAVARLEFTLSDSFTGEEIYLRTEERTSAGRLFNSANPDEMLKKLCDGYLKDLGKLLRN